MVHNCYSYLGVFPRRECVKDTSLSSLLSQDNGEGLTRIGSGAPCERETLGLGAKMSGVNIRSVVAVDLGVLGPAEERLMYSLSADLGCVTTVVGATDLVATKTNHLCV